MRTDLLFGDIAFNDPGWRFRMIYLVFRFSQFKQSILCFSLVEVFSLNNWEIIQRLQILSRDHFFIWNKFFLLLAGLSSLPKEKNSFEGNKEPPKKY